MIITTTTITTIITTPPCISGSPPLLSPKTGSLISPAPELSFPSSLLPSSRPCGSAFSPGRPESPTVPYLLSSPQPCSRPPKSPRVGLGKGESIVKCRGKGRAWWTEAACCALLGTKGGVPSKGKVQPACPRTPTPPCSIRAPHLPDTRGVTPASSQGWGWGVSLSWGREDEAASKVDARLWSAPWGDRGGVRRPSSKKRGHRTEMRPPRGRRPGPRLEWGDLFWLAEGEPRAMRPL